MNSLFDKFYKFYNTKRFKLKKRGDRVANAAHLFSAGLKPPIDRPKKTKEDFKGVNKTHRVNFTPYKSTTQISTVKRKL